MGLGEDAADGKKLKSSIDDMAMIAGQKPVVTKFKKSISNFKTRKDKCRCESNLKIFKNVRVY